MTSTFSNIRYTNLDEITFIGGTYKELSFDVYNTAGNPVNISTFTYNWNLSPFGQPDLLAVSASGVFRTDCSGSNRFTIYLFAESTAELSGKYVQQPIIVGNPGYEFRLGQGYINIIPASGLTSIGTSTPLAGQISALSSEVTVLGGSVVGVSASLVNVSASFVYATASQVTAGSSTQAIVTPSGLKGSGYNNRACIVPLNTSASLTGVELNYIRIPSFMDGWILADAQASCAGSPVLGSGSPTFRVTKFSSASPLAAGTVMTSTDISIDEGDFDSIYAKVPPVISTTGSSVFNGNRIKVQNVTAGSSVTYALVTLVFQKP